MKALKGIKLAALALCISACGGGTENTGGSGGGGGGGSGGSGGAGPCEATGGSSGDVTEVDVAVDSPLPAELSTDCPASNPTELEGVLLLGAISCPGLQVSGGKVTGCCAGVPADQNYSAVLTFKAGTTPVGEQVKLLPVPSTSPPTITISFSGRPVESYDTNRDAWCN